MHNFKDLIRLKYCRFHIIPNYLYTDFIRNGRFECGQRKVCKLPGLYYILEYELYISSD